MMLTTQLAICKRRGGILKQSYFSAGFSNYGVMGLNEGASSNVFRLPNLNNYPGVVNPDIWAKFALRNESMAAIKSDGTMYTTGDNTFGQLGHGDQNGRYALTKVLVETTVGSGIYKSDWVDVGVGTEFHGALDSSGQIWTCGRNDISAQLGDGTKASLRMRFYNTALTQATHPVARVTPITFVSMVVGHRFVYGIDTAGQLWSWGNNGSRQLGRQSNTIGNTRDARSPATLMVAGVSNSNYGPGTVVQSGDPDQIADFTQDTNHRRVDAPGPFVKAFAGGYHGGALTVSGDMWLWGLYSSGQRGDGVTSQLPAILPRIGGIPWVECYMGEYSTFVRNENGEVYAFGQNSSGQLGVGHNNNVSTPTKLPGAWRLIFCDLAHTGGIQVDGSLWMWGSNSQGQLGLGNTTAVNVPTRVGTATDWVQVVTGKFTSTATRGVV